MKTTLQTRSAVRMPERQKRDLLSIASLLLTLCLPCALLASPADYHASPGYGTIMDSLDVKTGNEAALESVDLISETTEGDGRVLLTYTATVSNTGGGYLGNVEAVLTPPAEEWPVELVTQFASLPDLPPNAPAVTTPTTLSLRCAAVDVALVKAALQDRQRVRVRSKELFQFSMPVVAVDTNMDTLCVVCEEITQPTDTGKRFKLRFTSANGSVAELAPNKLIIENPDIYTLDSNRPIADAVRSSHSMRSDEGKFRKSKYLEIETLVTLPDGQIEVEGSQRETIDVLVAGTFHGTQMDAYDGPIRDPYNPVSSQTFWPNGEFAKRATSLAAAMGNPRDKSLADLLGLFCLHYAFNDVQISKGITLDGEFLLRGMNLGVNLKWRDGALKKINFTLTNRAEVSMRLTAEAGAKNLDAPSYDLEHTIVSAPLPTIVIPIADQPLTFQPILNVKVGCSLSSPTRFVVPLQTSFETGFSMTWDDSKPEGQKYQYEPIRNATPIAMSDPTIAQALSVSANAWVEAGLHVMMGVDGASFAGPFITTKVNANFSLSPLAPQWWSLTGSADVSAGMQFKFLGFEIADIGGSIANVPNLFDLHATRPPAGGGGPLGNVAGDHVRWARAGKWGVGGPKDAFVARVTGTPEDVFIAMRTSIDKSVIMRVNGTGDIVWSQGGLVFTPRAIASTPDGGFMLAGNTVGNSFFLSRYDGNGTQLWTLAGKLTNASGTVQGHELRKVLVRDKEGGAFDVFVIGSRTKALNVLDADPFVLKYDEAGNLVWSKFYDSADAEFPTDAAFLPNGNMVLCGRGDLSPDGVTPPLAGAGDGGWLMTMDADGNVLGSVRTDDALGMRWNGVTAAPDGTIYTAGNLDITVLSGSPTLQIGKYDANLNLLAMVTVGEATASALPLPPSPNMAETPDHGHSATISTDGDPDRPGQYFNKIHDYLPQAGLTTWDTARRIVWTPAGIIVAGTSGLGANTAPLTMSFNEQLSLRWLTTHEREYSEEGLMDLVATDNGLLCVGYSEKYFDVSTHTAAPADNACALLLKLPFDGKVPLHPAAGSINRFLHPILHDSMAALDDITIPSPDHLYHGTINVALQPQTQAIIGGDLPNPLAPLTFTGWVPLEMGDANQPMTFAQWVEYEHLPAGSTVDDDYDSDGRTNGEEWFFGGDPFTQQNSRPRLSIGHFPDGGLYLETTRSPAAAGNSPYIEYSLDLQYWFPISDALWSAVGADPTNWETTIRYDLPVDNEPRKFFRASTP